MVVWVLFVPITPVNGQEVPPAKKPPIPVEIMFGNEEIYYLTILNLPFETGTLYAHLEVGATLMVMVYFERTLPP